MKISDVLSPELTRCAFSGRSKKRIIEALSQLLAKHLNGEHELSVRLFDNFVAREKLGSTGLGKGVAIPHCRTSGVKKIHGCLVKLTHPVDFDAIDDQPVDLIFALVVPEEKNDEHLSTLARIASIMQNDDYRERLRNCSEDAILYNTVLELERGKNL
ncbi:PTS IIA-like nitrogen regulatory protein PtsN [Porticoccaceae bacterium]|jgi:PTS system nitrogen regulatory IIA component|nr:PTS IIA-like nitrogen regulatory protein PtsN [Cellvibrionales bacterium]MDB3926378.1 PTS IIA-like nitrogen regulatory protein PtsN [Porticoccaceae bacterium]